MLPIGKICWVGFAEAAVFAGHAQCATHAAAWRQRYRPVGFSSEIAVDARAACRAERGARRELLHDVFRRHLKDYVTA
jgi:hypothetical protein